MFWVDWILNQANVTNFQSPAYSATIFASIVALLTNERIASGKSGLGLLNPLIYQHGEAFRDLTTGTFRVGLLAQFRHLRPGSNPGCGTAVFNATSGWDPVRALRSLYLVVVF